MTAVPRQIKRKAASRPAPRTVTVTGTGDYAEWEATARADFPARLLGELSSGDLERIIAALDKIVVDHNFPDENDDLAEHMGDVDPYGGLIAMAGEIFDAIGKLPSR